jgi:hypothetical protein
MTPVLVTPPTSSPVTLAEAKLHCRVDHADEDTLIDALIAAAVGYLDGWRGVLGRAIMPQTWSVAVDCAGRYVLPMPDVTAAEIDGLSLATKATAGGPEIEVDAAGTVLFTCAMPAEQLPAVKVIILLLVGHWFANREAVSAQMAEIPMAVDMLVASLRWRRL